MITSQDFNKTFFETAFNIAKNTFLQLLLVMTMVYVIIIAVITPILVYKLGVNFSFIQEYMSLGVFEQNEYLETFIENSMLNSFDPGSFNPSMIMTFIGVGILSFIILMLFSSWYYHFIFLLLDDYIKTNLVNLKASFLNSFSKKVFTIFFLTIISIILFIVFELLFVLFVIGLASIHFSLAVIGGFIGVLLLIALFFRFILVFPHIINTEASAMESLSYSFRTVSFKSALKYFAVMIVAYIVLMMVSMMLMSMKILGGVPGLIILTLLQVVFSSFTTALGVSSNLGLYYLYNPEYIDEEIELEENLDEDEDFHELELLIE